MAKIPFVKMHGLGNDFTIIDYTTLPKGDVTTDLTKMILNRRLGIGGDQLIFYTLDKEFSKTKKVSMRIYNPDGGKASACGNASRCLIRLIYDKYGIDNFTLNVDGRILHCNTAKDNKYTVNMGSPAYVANWMPKEDILLELAAKYNLGPKELICVDVGNPHLVIFSKLSEKDREIIGSQLQNSPIFPDGINVNFPIINGNEIDLIVYERGTGFTLACGSGACATFAGAIFLGRVANDSDLPVIVNFKLGSLKMHLENNEIIMQGSAEYSFFGEYLYD